MKTIIRILILAAAVFATASLRSEPVTLTRTEAFELHAALTDLSNGLSPDNIFIVADDINALDVTAKTYRAAVSKILQLQQTVNASPTPENIASFRAEDAKLAAAAEEKKVYELKMPELTKDEVKAAKISATQLATIKRLLKPSAPNPK